MPYTRPISGQDTLRLPVLRVPDGHDAAIRACGGSSQHRAVRRKRETEHMDVPGTPAQAQVLVALLPEVIPFETAQVLLVEPGPLTFEQFQQPRGVTGLE